jgi:cytochrome c5
MSQEQDAIFVRNFSLVLVFLTIVGIIAVIIAKLVYNDFLTTQHREEVVSERLAPVGSVNVGEPFVLGGEATAEGDAPAVAESGPADPGKATYGKICFACHDAGVGGAPKLGDKAAWADRLQKGPDMLVSNAINGMQGSAGIMPPKGGLSSLTDEEVRAAVTYMLAALDESPAGAATEPADAAPATADVSVSEPAVTAGRGKEVYDAACFICHATGVAGAPKIGDSSAWEPRLAQGMDTVYTHAIKGFMGEAGLMPPKGGRMDYSDDDVKAAVDYMVENSE